MHAAPSQEEGLKEVLASLARRRKLQWSALWAAFFLGTFAWTGVSLALSRGRLGIWLLLCSLSIGLWVLLCARWTRSWRRSFPSASTLLPWADRRAGLQDVLVSLAELPEGQALAPLIEVVQARLNPQSLLPWRPVLGLLLALLLPALGAMGVARPQALEQAWAALWARAVTPALAEELDEDEIVPVDLRLELIPPEYTGQDPRVLENASGDFEALPGTRVRVRGWVGQGWATLDIALEPGESQAARVDAQGWMDGEFLVEDAGSWTLLGRDDRGKARSSRSFRIRKTPDRRPRLLFVSLEHPDPLQSGDGVSVGAQVEDDFGVLRWRWSLVVDGSELRGEDLPLIQTPREAEAGWSFEPYAGLPADAQSVVLRLQAWDGAGSEGVLEQELPILTAARAKQTLRELVRRLLDSGLDRLAEHLEAQLRDGQTRPERTLLVDEHRAFAEAMAKYFHTATALNAALALIPQKGRYENILELELGPVLDELALAWDARDRWVRGKLTQKGGPLLSADSRSNRRTREAMVGGLEGVVLVLDRLGRQEELDRSLDMSESLEDALAELKEAIEAAKRGDDGAEERLRRALQKVAQLQAQLAQSMSKMDQPADPTNSAFQEMPESLSEMSLDELQRMAEAALAQAGRLSEQLQSMGASSGAPLSAEEMALLDEAAEALEKLAEEQGDLASALEQGGRQAPDDALMKKLEKLAEEAREHLEKARENALELEAGATVRGMAGAAQQSLDEAMRRVARGDGEGAKSQLEQAQRQAQRSGQIAGASGNPEGPREAVQGETKAAGKTLNELAALLDQPGSGAPGAQEQAGLRGELESLMEGLGKGKLGSMIRGAAGRPMRSAQGEMKRSEGELGAGKPDQAAGPARGAADQLQQASQMMRSMAQPQASRSPGQKGGLFQEMWGKQSPEDMVDTDEFVPDSELWDRLLQGSSEPVPDGFEGARDQYYEELLK